MEEKCHNALNTVITVNTGCSTSSSAATACSVSTASTSTSTTTSPSLSTSNASFKSSSLANHFIQPSNKSSHSHNSMSLIQPEFENSQHAFAEVLDEETTTSGVLETFEISSSNSLPACSDVSPVLVSVEYSSSTDTIKLVEASEPSSCNNEFYNASEVFVINDDDDDDVHQEVELVPEEEDEDDDEEEEEEDDDDDDVEEDDEDEEEENNVLVSETEVSHKSATQLRCTARNNQQPNGVIVTASGAIYLETPVTEEQQHHHSQIGNLTNETGKPKRLSDEFRFVDDAETETLVEVDDEASSLATTVKYKVEIQDATADSGNSEAQQDKVSFRLKKMHINNNNNNNSNKSTSMATTATTKTQDNLERPSSSQIGNIYSSLITAPSMAEIESMDLIERRDFETEQRLTGGVLLKSSAIIDKNTLNLKLITPCLSQQQQQQQQSQQPQQQNKTDSNNKSSRSNSNNNNDTQNNVCTYENLATTPTSSRQSKSTAKLNLRNTLSQLPQAQTTQQQQQSQQQQQQHVHVETLKIESNSKLPLQKSKICKSPTSKTSTSTTSTTTAAANATTTASVIVEAPTTSALSRVELFDGHVVKNNATSATSKTATTAICQSGTVEQLSAEQSQPSQHLETQSQSKDASCSAAVTASSTTSSGASSTTSTSSLATSSSSSSASSSASNFERDSRDNGGCSRTIAVRTIATGDDVKNYIVICNDLQSASTSSARCQYAPPRASRQVHASAQTNMTSTMNFFGGAAARSVSLRRRRNETTASLEDFSEDGWADCDENNSDLEEICTCHHSNTSDSSSHGGSNTSLNETDDLVDASSGFVMCGGKEGDLSNYIQMVSISEDAASTSADCSSGGATTTSTTNGAGGGVGGNTQRKRKFHESHYLDNNCNDNGGVIYNSGGNLNDANRKRIAYDFASTPRSSQGGTALALTASTPTSTQQQFLHSVNGSPLIRRSTPRSIIPTRDHPPPELAGWLSQFQRWSQIERLLAIDRLIAHCEPTQVRHMMKVIEPQFQRDFISLLPRELALQVLAYLEPKDLLRAAQTCRSWRFLCDDNLLWKEKYRKAQILTESQTDRPKRGRAGNMPPIASPWKAAYMRQHIIEMNWRSRPIREPKVLKGHDDHVITCLQFSGNRIVSGSDDNTLKVWSAVTGRCLRTLVGHTGGVWSSQMSGNIIISGSTDRTLKVWDMETGHCVHTLLGHTSTVRCMHLHGNKVVSGSRDATLRVWDIEQGVCLQMLVGHLAAVRCVQYDGKLIVSGAYDYMVKIWNPERQECLHTLQGHTNRVYSLQFDGLHVVSGSLDTSIRVWDVETGNCKHTLMGHQSLTSGMELRQNILVSGNADSTVKVWDITTGQCLQTLSGSNKHQSAVTCLQFNSRFVVTSSDDGTVKLWDVKTGEFIRNLVALESGGSGGVVWRIRANDTKLICAVGSRNGTEETKLMVLDFDVEGACVKCS